MRHRGLRSGVRVDEGLDGVMDKWTGPNHARMANGQSEALPRIRFFELPTGGYSLAYRFVVIDS